MSTCDLCGSAWDPFEFKQGAVHENGYSVCPSCYGTLEDRWDGSNEKGFTWGLHGFLGKAAELAGVGK